MAQAETANIIAPGVQCSAEVKFKTWSRRLLNLLAKVMRSGALVAQAETYNTIVSGIERNTEVRFKTWSYPLGSRGVSNSQLVTLTVTESPTWESATPRRGLKVRFCKF